MDQLDKSLAQLQRSNKHIKTLKFKPSGTFANSLLKNVVTTRVIRDIEPGELQFVKGKTIAQVDAEDFENAQNASGSDAKAAGGLWEKLSRVFSVDLKFLDEAGQPEDMREQLERIQKAIVKLSTVFPLDQATTEHVQRQLERANALLNGGH